MEGIKRGANFRCKFLRMMMEMVSFFGHLRGGSIDTNRHRGVRGGPPGTKARACPHDRVLGRVDGGAPLWDHHHTESWSLPGGL